MITVLISRFLWKLKLAQEMLQGLLIELDMLTPSRFKLMVILEGCGSFEGIEQILTLILFFLVIDLFML